MYSLSCVPQGSVIGPCLTSVYAIAFFNNGTHFASYADDNALYCLGRSTI